MNVQNPVETIQISNADFRRAFFYGTPASFIKRKLAGTGLSDLDIRALYFDKVKPYSDQAIDLRRLDGHRWNNFRIQVVD